MINIPNVPVSAFRLFGLAVKTVLQASIIMQVALAKILPSLDNVTIALSVKNLDNIALVSSQTWRRQVQREIRPAVSIIVDQDRLLCWGDDI